MSTIDLNEEQTKLFRICLKHAEPLKPNWDKVAEDAGLVSTSAASQRWGRLYKILAGNEKQSTPNKAKGNAGKSAAGVSKQKNGKNNKATAAKSSKTPENDSSDEVDGKTASQPATQTPKKRARDGHDHKGSDLEDETPPKVPKTEVKNEAED